MKTIRLTRGKVALVDDKDFERVGQYRWYAQAVLSNKFYARNDRLGLLHRFIMGISGKDTIDHVNGNPLDNRRKNLRICSFEDNLKNKNLYKNNTSGYKGVSWKRDINKWEAYISVKGIKINLGKYYQAEDASLAYNGAVKKYYREFGRPNL